MDSIVLNDPIETYIKELKDLSTKGSLKAAQVQRALKCTYPAALNIIQAFDYSKQINIKIEDVFKISKKKQLDLLQSLIDEHINNFGYSIEDIYPRLMLEMQRIQDLDMVCDFIVAKIVADSLQRIDGKPHFVGLGCSSLISHIIGITSWGDRTSSKYTLDPNSYGLIFQRAFSKGKSISDVFGFYVDNTINKKLINELIKIFGKTVSFNQCNHDCILTINNVKIRIFNTIDSVQDIYASYTNILESSSIATFQEDYMHLLHYVSGYNYDEANNIRMAACGMDLNGIEKYRNDFVYNTWNKLPYQEDYKLFDEIVYGIRYARCKAFYICTKPIIDEYFPF